MEEANQAQGGKLHFGYLVVAALVLTSFIPLSLAKRAGVMLGICMSLT